MRNYKLNFRFQARPQVTDMKFITILTVLIASALALPFPSTLTGEALEKELELLNAPEPWEQRVMGNSPSFTQYPSKVY